MVPAFGVKQDAIPGFVRDTWFTANKAGDYYGQCAELCGKEHAYMVTSIEQHVEWISECLVHMGPWPIPTLNTAILLTSGATLTIAHHALIAAQRSKAVFWMWITVLLGITFISFQAYEYIHAEILALGQAAKAVDNWRLVGATLYVTKEPCPMCSGATLMSRLKRVVYAVPDPKMGCLGGATDLNALPQSNHHLETTRSILEKPCLDLLRAYFQLKRKED